MSVRSAVAAIWDFLVGDDWRLAAASAVAIGLTAIAASAGLGAWWAAPIVALLSLRWSLRGVRPSATNASRTRP